MKPDTLRAWERRYGLPSPERTSGRHRLYSQHDIEILKWLVARQDEGLTISRAVDLYHKLEEEGQDPLMAIPEDEGEPTTPLITVGDSLLEMRHAWIEAIKDFEEARADAILSQAFALFPPEVVVLDLIRPSMVAIGDGWHTGEVTAQQEHFASAIALRRINSLLAATPLPHRSERILVACPPQEVHTFSPLLITWLLRRRGFATIYLGANVPLDRFEMTIRQSHPDLVILTAQQLHTAATLLDMAYVLQKLNVPLAFGGLIFIVLPQLHSRIPGSYLGNTIDHAAQNVEYLLRNARPLPPAELTGDAFLTAREHFLTQEPYIRASVRESMETRLQQFPHTHLNTINSHMSENIAAALKLGDVNLLGRDLEWVASLLSNREVPGQVLTEYINAYCTAASRYLDERGAPVTDWLQETAENCRNGA